MESLPVSTVDLSATLPYFFSLVNLNWIMIPSQNLRYPGGGVIFNEVTEHSEADMAHEGLFSGKGSGPTAWFRS